MPTNIILSSLEVGGQFPLNSKLYFKTLAELQDLGVSNSNPFKYYEQMIVDCVETKKRYIWRELESPTETGGVLASNITYPASTISNDIDYSGRTFNFFELSSGDGIDGVDGTNGTDGNDGVDGQGVPLGGTANQILAKIDGSDFNTEWKDPSSNIIPDNKVLIFKGSGNTSTLGNLSDVEINDVVIGFVSTFFINGIYTNSEADNDRANILNYDMFSQNDI